MKIKINENESYEVKINEGIYSAEEFLALLERLTGVLTTLMQQKIVKKITPTQTPSIPTHLVNGRELPIGIKCPHCSSINLYKQGFSNLVDGKKIQRWFCRDCDRSFREDFAFKNREPDFVPKRRRSKVITRWKDRDEVIRLIKLHYFGTREQKEAFARNKHESATWTHVLKCISNLRKRYNIKPEEIGLKEFPTRYEKFREEFVQEQKNTEENSKEELKDLIQQIKERE